VRSTQPPFLYPDYKSTVARAPSLALLAARDDTPPVPAFAPSVLAAHDADLTKQSSAAPLGERIIVAGRVLDEDGKPVRNSLVELWQCNAAGRYAHPKDQHDAPLDPHFSGCGKTLTNDQGWYRFVTIKPGAYPWGNHSNAWRPAHIHFSLFGNAYAQRLITQMYFPGDPLLAIDPIYHSVPEFARSRLVGAFDLSLTVEGAALGYRFDIVLGGTDDTPTGI
jgi:protocatechuate 3,4-dioxygenase, beta subunit